MFRKGLIACLLAVSAVSARVVVRLAPPRPLVEAVVPAPGVGYVWTPGYYGWSGQALAKPTYGVRARGWSLPGREPTGNRHIGSAGAAAGFLSRGIGAKGRCEARAAGILACAVYR
jgi:hypothetical protein